MIFSSMTGIWLAVMVIMIVIELIIPGLVSIWFAIGALAALVSAALKAPLWLQLILFVAVSVTALFLTRPLAKKYVNSRIQPTNADAVIGRECIVTEKIDNILGTGAVKVGGKSWTAVSFVEGIVIEPGERVRAEEIRGVKLVVRPIEGKQI